LPLVNSSHANYRAINATADYERETVIADMKPRKRKRGGQPKPASERKRNNVTIRLVDDLRAKLEAASQASGRSLSEEMAWRLTMSFLFNTEIQEVSTIQRGLGTVMVEMLTKVGWKVGPEEIKRAISNDLRDNILIFMPPEHRQLLKERREELSERSHRDLDEQRAERDKAIDPAHVAARSSTRR
jgi:hypothetical protein